MGESPAKKRGLPQRIKMRATQHFVEELTSRSETSLGSYLPISSIEPDPQQPRASMGDLSDLVRSIQEKGVLEPILVRSLPVADAEAEEDDPLGLGLTKSPRRFRIIAGERRFRAAQEAGLVEMPAIEMEVSEQEALEIALIENLQRKDLTPFEEADGYQILAERHGYTHEEIAESVGKSRTVVTESLALLQMPARVRDTVQALGITSKSLLLEVLKADTPEEMIRLLEEVSSHGLSRDDLRRRLRTRDQKSTSGSKRRKPYVFRFRAPDKTFNLSLSFRQAEVERNDLIDALEQILTQLRTDEAAE